VLFDSGFQANVQVKLVFLVVSCPCHFFKTIGLSVDELGVLWNRLVWVPMKEVETGNSFSIKEFKEARSADGLLAEKKERKESTELSWMVQSSPT